MSDPAALLALATDAAHAAGALLRARAGAPPTGVDAKSSRTDLVSDADRDAERLLVGRLRAARPDDALIAEEGSSAHGASGISWLVDPLDGTINYLWGIPHWSVSVAASDADGDVVAVVHDPSRGETFTWARGDVARRDGHELRLTGGGDLAEAMIGTGFSYRAEERALQARELARVLPAVRDIRRAGSAALDLAWVAAGRLDGFYEGGLSPWDVAAGAALVRAAGGTVVTLTRAERPDVVIATRPGLADRLRALVAGE